MVLTCHILGPGPICKSWSIHPTNSLVHLTIPCGCNNNQLTNHVNALYCFTAVQTKDTTLLATPGFVLAWIDHSLWADNGLYPCSLFTTLLFDNAIVHLGLCIYIYIWRLVR